jgi:hypothetical protein
MQPSSTALGRVGAVGVVRGGDGDVGGDADGKGERGGSRGGGWGKREKRALLGTVHPERGATGCSLARADQLRERERERERASERAREGLLDIVLPLYVHLGAPSVDRLLCRSNRGKVI